MHQRHGHPFDTRRRVRLPGAVGETVERPRGKRRHILMQRGELIRVICRLRRVVEPDQMKIVRCVLAAPTHAVEKPAGELRVSAENPVQRGVGAARRRKAALVALFRRVYQRGVRRSLTPRATSAARNAAPRSTPAQVECG